MQRGEVWWANLPPPAGRRPVLLLSRDRAYLVRTAVTLAPVTRNVRNIDVEVPLSRAADGMPQDCVVNLDSIGTFPISLIENRVTTLAPDKMAAVARAIRFALALD